MNRTQDKNKQSVKFILTKKIAKIYSQNELAVCDQLKESELERVRETFERYKSLANA